MMRWPGGTEDADLVVSVALEPACQDTPPTFPFWSARSMLCSGSQLSKSGSVYLQSRSLTLGHHICISGYPLEVCHRSAGNPAMDGSLVCKS